MIDIKIPKEIRKYKEKFYFNLTLRQIICTGLALVINIPLYLVLTTYVSSDFASWAIMIVGTPIFLVGFVEYNGMNFEKFMKCLYDFEMKHKKKRIYSSKNLYQIAIEEFNEEEKIERIKKKNKRFLKKEEKKLLREKAKKEEELRRIKEIQAFEDEINRLDSELKERRF